MGTALSELLAQAAYGKSAWKLACRTVATANVTLSGLQTIGGVALAVGDRVLVTGQTNAAQNGPYTVSSGAWSRGVDFDSASDVQYGSRFAITDGTAAGQVWMMTSPTSGPIALGATLLSFGLESDGSITLYPSGDTTGVADRTAIQAKIDADEDVVLIAGETYTLDQALILKSGSRIRTTANGERARIVRASTWVPAVGNADSSSNHAIRINGTTIATGLMQVAQTMFVGAISATWSGANVNNIVVGDWVQVRGTNAADPMYGQSDSVNYQSIVKVATKTFGDGYVFTFDERTGQHHASGVALSRISPVDDVEIRDIELDFSGTTGTPVAVGIYGYLCRRVRLKNVAAHGFSRAAFEWHDSERILEDGCSSRGQCNSLSLRRTCYDVESKNAVWLGEIERQHPQGVPRGVFCDLYGNSGNAVRNATIQIACIAYSAIGGLACGVDGLRVVDIDATAAASRNPDWGSASIRGKGAVIDMGAQVDASSKGIGCYALNVSAESAWNNSTDGHAFTFRDQTDLQAANLQLSNAGPSPFAPPTGYNTWGLFVCNSSGTIGLTTIKGCNVGIRFAGNLARVIVSSVGFTGQGGGGTNGSIPLSVNHSGGNGTGPRMINIGIDNANNPLCSFGGNFTGNPDRKFLILRVDQESNVYTDVVAAKGTAASQGQCLQWTSGADDFAATTAASTKAIVALGASSNGWALVAMGSAAVRYDGVPALVRGDLLETGTGGGAFVNNAPANPLTAAWRVMTTAATGQLAQCVRAIG